MKSRAEPVPGTCRDRAPSPEFIREVRGELNRPKFCHILAIVVANMLRWHISDVTPVTTKKLQRWERGEVKPSDLYAEAIYRIAFNRAMERPLADRRGGRVPSSLQEHRKTRVFGDR